MGEKLLYCQSVSIFELLDTQTQNGHLIDTQTHGQMDTTWTQTDNKVTFHPPATHQKLFFKAMNNILT